MALDIGDVEYLPPSRFGADATTSTPGFFSSPQDLWTAGQQTDAFVTAMSAAVSAVKDWSQIGKNIPPGTGAAFDAFRKSWSDFFTSELASKARVVAYFFTSNLSGQLRNFQEQAADWAGKLKKWGVKIAAIAPQGAQGGASNVMMWVGIATVSIVGLFIIGKLIHTATLGGAALEEAEDEALKIAEAKRRKKADRTAYSIA